MNQNALTAITSLVVLNGKDHDAIQAVACWSPNRFFVIGVPAFSDINKEVIGELQKGHGCRLAVVAFLLAA